MISYTGTSGRTHAITNYENGFITKESKNYSYDGQFWIGNELDLGIQFISQPEGYIEPIDGNDLSQGFDYIFQYKDHLGNIRLSYKDSNNDGSVDSSEIIEENNYYPFGLEHKGYNNVTSGNVNSVASKFKYNGVELEESLGLNLYEMELRLYDPTIARWNAIDPVTHHSYSTYSAFDNNPVFWADPSGANSEEDFLGRNKFDKMDLYIPPYRRGEIGEGGDMYGGGSDGEGSNNSKESNADSKDNSKNGTNDQIDTKRKARLYLKDILSFLKIKASLAAAKIASKKSNKAFSVFAPKTKILNKKYAQEHNSQNEGSILNQNFLRTDIIKQMTENFGNLKIIYKAGLEISDFRDDIGISTGLMRSNTTGSPIRFYNSDNDYVGSLIFESISLRNKFMNRYYYEIRDAQIKKNLNDSNNQIQSGRLIKK